MKAFTSIEQSKKLAKILPLESADMRYHTISQYNQYPCDEIIYTIDFGKPSGIDIPCWSLAALLSILKPINGNTYTIYGTLDDGAMITFEEVTCAFHEEEIIDAVYRMVLWLNEQNIL